MSRQASGGLHPRHAIAISVGACLGLALAGERNAHAYCRTSVCDNSTTSEVCTPADPADCGIPLFWGSPCVTFSIQQDASPLRHVTVANMKDVVTAGFSRWVNAECSASHGPRISVAEAPLAVCNRHEYNKTAGNANIIMFRDYLWPYEGTVNTLALTTVTYNLKTGEIYDSDMELNSIDNNFTLPNQTPEYDLQSIITHETGHFLGMAHSKDSQATMFPTYQLGSIQLRELSPDDVAGICAIYPPGDVPSGCDPTPRHGFSPLCASDQTSQQGDTLALASPAVAQIVPPQNCSVAAVGRTGPLSQGFGWLVAVAVAVGVGAARRRPRG